MLDFPHSRFAVRDAGGAAEWNAAVARLREAPGFWLLESTLADARLGAWSFAGAAPLAILRAHGDRIAILPGRGDARVARRAEACTVLDALRRFLPRAPRVPGAPPFAGGLVGWLGYEIAAQLERVPVRRTGGIGVPDAAWLLADRVLAFDPAEQRLVVCALGFGASEDEAQRVAERAAERIANRITRGESDPFEAGVAATSRAEAHAGEACEPLRLVDDATGLVLGAFCDESSYAKSVARIRDAILAGDVYQANLTHRLAARFGGDAWRLYQALRARSPAPFAAYVSLPEIAVVGSSPERFLHVAEDGAVESRPIKGTRRRGATAEEDARLCAELLASEKERAENAMIVDLVRNDLGRVCAPGTIEVPELFAIERYATLFQMVSTVRGRLAPGRDAIDALAAAFPPGSMTGAPKIAAIDLLAQLEPVPRGIYSGVLGWIDARGSADLSVVIRTLFCRGTRAWLHVGGGIVLGSDPAAEWRETLAKARALLDALAAAH